MNSMLIRVMMATAEVQTDWDVGSFLINSKEQLKQWGGLVISLLGVILIIVGVFQLVKKFISPQSAQGGWVMPIIMVIVGGALLTGGWSLLAKIAGGGQKTIEDLGTSDAGAVIVYNLPEDFYE